jgi:hypothetical protein
VNELSKAQAPVPSKRAAPAELINPILRPLRTFKANAPPAADVITDANNNGKNPISLMMDISFLV